jgi:hypothetical protein
MPSSLLPSLPSQTVQSIKICTINTIKSPLTHDSVFKAPTLPKLQPVVANLVPNSTITPPSTPSPAKRRNNASVTTPTSLCASNGKSSVTYRQIAKSPSNTCVAAPLVASLPKSNQKPSLRSTPLIADESTPKAKHRYETSLGQLTRKFINLLQSASDGVSFAHQLLFLSIALSFNFIYQILFITDIKPKRCLKCTTSTKATYL